MNRVYYVNYCRSEDFEVILKSNVDVNLNGSIIICRYGEIYRGNKVRLLLSEMLMFTSFIFSWIFYRVFY